MLRTSPPLIGTLGITNMRSLDLDALLGIRHEHATFHDAELKSLQINYSADSISFTFLIPCGFSDNRKLKYHEGELTFRTILFYYFEPSAYRAEKNDMAALWITADGPLPDAKVKVSKELPSDLPPDAFAHYFYSDTTNSFIVIAAKAAAFEWLGT